MKRVNLDLEFEKFKETYKGDNLEEDWRTYQEENDLIDESNNSEILENDSLIGSAYWEGRL